MILCEDALENKEWSQLSYFTQIYFVRGNTLLEESYDRVNISKAKQVVILIQNHNVDIELSDEAEL